jgi:hypothetical protein
MSKLVEIEGLEEIIRSHIVTDHKKMQSVAYIDLELHAPGKAKVGGKEIQVDHEYLLVFIDLQPGANWMHPCSYLIIDPATRKVTRIDSIQPPVFGALPSTWRVVWRSPEISDWQLFPISTSPDHKSP